jgi:archaellum biogenesis protein FlaJ (TadC family)
MKREEVEKEKKRKEKKRKEKKRKKQCMKISSVISLMVAALLIYKKNATNEWPFRYKVRSYFSYKQ